ncbi:tetratricopeptide repeat protein [Pseudoalteromonas espejiana]
MINEQLFKEALALIEKKLHSKAIPILSTVTASQPELDQAWLHLSKCYEAIGDVDNQSQAYKQFEMIAWFNQQLTLAKDDLSKNEFKNTQKRIQQLLKLVPNEKRCLLLLSDAALKASDLQTYLKVSEYNYNCYPTSLLLFLII